MIESSSLLGIRYLKKEYFREEKDWLNTRFLWLDVLKQELKTWNDEKHINIFPRINRLKLELFFNTIRWGSGLYHSIKGKKIMWMGEISNRDFLFKSQPYNLIVSDARLSQNSLFPLIFNSNVSLYPIYSYYVPLYSGIVNNDENRLQEGLSILTDIFSQVNPDLIVLNNDIFPSNRGIIVVAHELGIPTVEIQHGIYMSDFIPTGREVDYVFVWGKHFKDIYVKNKIRNPDRVKILGYPYQTEKYGNHNREKTLVTYLGQSFEVYDNDLISSKVETVQNLKKICDNLNFDFVYRPHPIDNLNLLKKELKNINFTSPKETLEETIKKGDIFISFNSTTLIEANLHSKLSIQLKSYDLPSEDFENLGACSKSVETFKELEDYLKQVKNGELTSFYRPVKESYIKIPVSGPGKRFLELIEDII